MDTVTGELTKLPDMIMCGDHPAVTRPELTLKETQKVEEKEKKEKMPFSYQKISPTTSRTERYMEANRNASEHALKVLENRRRVRSLDKIGRPQIEGVGNGPLFQATVGSFRWPPYLLAVWVAVLLATHLLHCVVNLLEKAMPAVRSCTQYFRAWTEDTWKNESDANHRLYPIGLACVTGLLYTLYYAMYVVYSVAVWSIEPLCNEDDKKELTDVETKVTNYIEEVNAKSSVGEKIN